MLARGRVAVVLRSVAAAAVVATIAVGVSLALTRSDPSVIRVGSKNFTEQIVLGELIASLIETRTSLRVERRLNLGGTFICDRALRSGDIDLYVEYSGTAHTAIFHQTPDTDPKAVFEAVRQRYAGAGVTLFIAPDEADA